MICAVKAENTDSDLHLSEDEVLAQVEIRGSVVIWLPYLTLMSLGEDFDLRRLRDDFQYVLHTVVCRAMTNMNASSLPIRKS